MNWNIVYPYVKINVYTIITSLVFHFTYDTDDLIDFFTTKRNRKIVSQFD